MGLAKAKQLAFAIEAVPNTAATLTGADVIDLLEGDFEFEQDFLSREPSGGSLTTGIQPSGQSRGRITARLDLKGSGVAATAPKLGRMLEASFFERIDIDHLNVSSLTEDLVPGDQLTGGTSGATALVAAYIAQTGSAVSVPVIVTSGTFAGTEALNSALKGNGVATTTASPLTADQGHAYRPLSSTSMTVDTSAGWSASDPGSGQGIVVKDGETVVGEAFFISQSTNTVTMEFAWGTIAAGNTLHSKTAGGVAVSATVAGSPNLTQLKGKTGTAQFIRHRLKRLLTGCRASFSLEAESGSAGSVSVTLQGSVQPASDSAQLVASGSEATTPPRFIAPNGKRGSAHLNGVPVPTIKVSIDAANQLVRRQDANAPEGDAGGAVTGRTPQVSWQIDQVSVNTLDPMALIRAATAQRFGFQVGNTSGNRVAVVCPAAQISGMADDDVDGNSTHTLTINPRGADLAGDNEVYVCFS